MKVKTFWFFILIPILTLGQFEIESDNLEPVETVLGIPNSDSIQFEYRLWNISTHWSHFTQVNITHENQWNYRYGFINHNGVITVFGSETNAPMEELWSKLDSIGIRSLKNQDEIMITISKNGNSSKLSSEEYERLIPLGSTFTRIELFNQSSYRLLEYDSPVPISTSLKNSKEEWEADELHAVAGTVTLINGNFDWSSQFKNFLYSTNFSDNLSKYCQKRSIDFEGEIVNPFFSYLSDLDIVGITEDEKLYNYLEYLVENDGTHIRLDVNTGRALKKTLESLELLKDNSLDYSMIKRLLSKTKPKDAVLKDLAGVIREIERNDYNVSTGLIADGALFALDGSTITNESYRLAILLLVIPFSVQ